MGLYVKSVQTGLQQQRKYPIPKSTNMIIKLHSKKKKKRYDHQSEQTAYRVGEKSLVATSVQGSIYKELQTLTPIEQNCQPVSESTK